MTWSSSNTVVATVSGNGLVTAVANGTAQIRAQSGNTTGTANITVAESVPTRITIAPTSHTLEMIGATVQLTATVRDQRNNIMSGQSITWSSADEAVATVSGAGLVTAVSNGMAEIAATSGSLSASASIAVAEPVATSITVDPASHTLEAIGDTVELAAVVLDQHENAMADMSVTWSSGDDAVATVDENGVVTAVDNGMAEITAQAGDAMGTASITVAQVPASISIEVAADATTLTEIGQTLQLMVSVSDANENAIAEQAVTWTSGDEAVVTVDEDGLVEAVGNGMAEVMAASGDVSAMVSITVTITVDEVTYVPWEGVKVAPGNLIFTVPLLGEISLMGCASGTIGGELNDYKAPFGDYTITVHFSIWQRSDDMGGTWINIEDTRKTFDACAYDPEEPGKYRLVGDVTLNGERAFRASENSFDVE